ncbi:MAG: glycosyltransferase family 39 protein [Thermosynechococcaceae cyanobacterium]
MEGKRFKSYGGLVAAIALGLILRFWNLDLKPLWLDETITLIFATGHRYNDIPTEILMPLTDLLGQITWQPQSCAAIAQAVNEQSTHPPLFFCLLHQWLGHWQHSAHSLRWQLRSLSALFGVGAIAAMYWLNRVAFSHRAGLMAAGLMAVSPFAVYLSQEARHYTLPLLTITLSLIPFVQIGLAQRPSRRVFGLGLAWVALNSLGFYIHYFCLLAFIGQAIVLLAQGIRNREGWRWGWILAGSLLFGLSLVPWLPYVWQHTQRSETDWLQFGGGGLLDWLGPIARLLAGAIVSVVMLPVEAQPLGWVVASGVVMLAIAALIARFLWQRFPLLWQMPALRLLGGFLLVLWAEYLGLVYGLHKDLTLAFRYNFVFYPALCAVLAASFSLGDKGLPSRSRSRWLPWVVIAIGLVSTGCVVTDLAFQKPFQPKPIAEQLLRPTSPQLVLLKAYQTGQDIALGLSEGFAVEQYRFQVPQAPEAIQWGFMASKTPPAAETVMVLTHPLPSSFRLWSIGALHQPPSKATAMTLRSRLGRPPSDMATCQPAASAQNSMGVQYQPFQCQVASLHGRG